MDDYPTELVSHEFFGDKELKVGGRETVEIVSVDDDHVQIRCAAKKGARSSYSEEVQGRYNAQMPPH